MLEYSEMTTIVKIFMWAAVVAFVAFLAFVAWSELTFERRMAEAAARGWNEEPSAPENWFAGSSRVVPSAADSGR